MGSGPAYNPAILRSASASAAATGKSLFNYAATVASGAAPVAAAPILDPKGRNKAGNFIRECRDSDDHPESRGVFVNLDGTGSMSRIPHLLVQKLPGLMETLVKEGWLQHPSILFAKNCDFMDRVPFELGQYENSNAIDDTLTSMLLSGGGSGYMDPYEAYTLPLYVAGFHTKLDCLEKRGKKGFMFIIGDERIYPTLTHDRINDVFGIDEKKDYTLAELLTAAREKFSVHWILPSGTNHWKDSHVVDFLRDLFGEKFHELENPSAICSFIAGIIALEEGYEVDDVNDTLVNADTDPLTTKAATSALSVYAATAHGGTLAKKGSSSDELVTEDEANGSSRL